MQRKKIVTQIMKDIKRKENDAEENEEEDDDDEEEDRCKLNQSIMSKVNIREELATYFEIK